MSAARTGREWLYHAVAVLGICALFAGGLELYVRAVVDDGMQFDLEMWKYAVRLKQKSPDPLIGHVHRPGSAAHLMGVDVRINAAGLRDNPTSYARTEGNLRVVMLGDSFTEGWGVPFEATFSKRVERLFAQAGAPAEVINAGIGNFNTVQAVQLFLTEGQKYAPDVVVLNFTYNDAEAVPHDRVPGPIARHCYACTYMAGRIDALMRLVGLRRPWSGYYLDLFDGGRSPGWHAAKAALGRLSAFCRQRNIALLVANYPELHDIRNYRFAAITTLIREATAQEGGHFLDLLPAVADVDAAALWVTPQDVHPNARANELFAAALFRELFRITAALRSRNPA